MKIDPQDPRLTAYALGELAEADKAAFEKLLADDPEARQEIDRIRNASGNLTAHLEAEACPRLEPEQRHAIYDRLDSKVRPAGSNLKWWIAILTGAAAGIVLAVLMLPKNQNHPIGLVTKATRDEGSFAPAPVPTTPSQPVFQTADGFKAPVGTPTSVPLNSFVVTNGGKIASSNGDMLLASSGHLQSYDIQRGPGYPDVNVGFDSEIKAKTINPHRGIGMGRGGSSFAGSAVVDSSTPQSVTIAPGQETTLEDKQAASSTLGSTQPVGVGGGGAGYNFNINGSLAKSTEGGGTAGITLGGGTWNGGQMIVSNGVMAITVIGGIVTSSGGVTVGNGAATGAIMVGGNGSSYILGGTSDYNGPQSSLHPYENRFTPSQPVAQESYAQRNDNPFYAVARQPLSTFGMDVDTASYANIRRFLTQNQLPPPDAVRIEEMLNYFTYDYPAPRGNDPFGLYVEMGECPWNPAHRLALIGMKAKEVKPEHQPRLNLVFLIDISGSMADNNKLPLIKEAFRLLVQQLDANDRVSIVVYANNSYVALPPTPGDRQELIMRTIDSLKAEGGTNGGEGIQNAYRAATQSFIKGGINRVILCTDGDFNIGITDKGQLANLIEQNAKTGVFLNVFGFGMGNLKDDTMSKLATSGRGQYAYIDDMNEARKHLVDEVRSTLLTVAKDAKVQIEFNPTLVYAYRLIGYENHVMQARDFNNDQKTAGAASVGSSRTVTALYEIIPAAEQPAADDNVDPLKYQSNPSNLHPNRREPAPAPAVRNEFGDEWMTIKLRYKEPAGDVSKLLSAAVKDTHLTWQNASDDYRFAAAVATFGMSLRNSPYRGNANCDLAFDLAKDAHHRDPNGYRAEFLDMIRRARDLGQR